MSHSTTSRHTNERPDLESAGIERTAGLRRPGRRVVGALLGIGALLGASACGSKVTTPMPSITATTTYTMAQVKTHHDQSSCWVAIDGGVYDLTKWISQHPGGPDKILGICGTDATQAFEHQHSKDSSPKQHLAGFQIGRLA